MKISINEARANFDSVIGTVQQNGRKVELYQGEKVVAVISPVAETSQSAVNDFIESDSKAKNEYFTWGETLADL